VWNTDEWHYVVFTWNSTALKLYTDNILRDTLLSPVIPSSNNYNWSVGGNSEVGLYFNGTVDEVAIFNRSLSPEEIEQLYNNGIGRPIDSSWFDTTGLVGLWHFDIDGNDNSTTAYDSSGSGNNGTLQGDAYHTDGHIVPNAEANNTIWFATQANITADGWDANYSLYYGNPSAGSPPADGSEVYLFYDDFEDGDISDWTNIGVVVTTNESYEGSYGIALESEDKLYQNPISPGDYVLTAFIKHPNPNGGIGYPNAYFGIGDITGEGTGATRFLVAKKDAANFIITHDGYYDTGIPADSFWHKFTIIINGSNTHYFIDDVEAGNSPRPGGYPADDEVGFVDGGDPPQSSWADLISVRKYVSPEPTAGLLDEEALEAVERVSITIISPYKTYNITFIGSLSPGEKIIIYGSGFSPNGTVEGMMPRILPGKSMRLRFGNFNYTLIYYVFWEVR
jgi:hypothetical protein